MSENVQRLQSTTNSTATDNWTARRAYLLAVSCLLLGVALGYLFRGSASQNPAAAAASSSQTSPGPSSTQAGTTKQPTPEAQAALAQAVAPLMEAVKANPGDYDSLVKLGDLLYDGQQFSEAIQYYERALAIHPENVDVRTDMGTAYWYSGNADKAVEAMQAALKYGPGHPQTLFNLGWVRWQGKADPKGAIEAWQQLLKTNPDYPQKDQVEKYIAKAREHAARG